MKNIYAFVVSLFLVSGAFAQGGFAVPGHDPLRTPVSVQAKPSMASRFTDQIIIDYDYTDSAAQVGIGGNIYDTRYAWPMNMHYEVADSINSYTLFRYCTVVFDSIIDSYNQNPYNRSTLQSIVVDSLFFSLGQENNSGLDDTLIVKVLSVLGNKYPGTTVLWSDTVFFSAGAPLDVDWLQFHTIGIPVGYAYTSNTQRIAVKLEYYGDKSDTAGFLAGFGYNGTCTSGIQIGLDTYMNPVGYNPGNQWATLPFMANSYIYHTYFEFLLPATIPAQFPGPQSGWLYNECNGTPNFQYGADAFFRVQNIGIYPMLTVSDSGVGIQEQSANGMKLFQNSPNPFTNETTIRYSVQKPGKVTIEVTDLTGRIISVMDEGYRSAGSFSATFNAGKLSAGTYFYTLKTDNGNLTNRMVVK